MLLLQFIFIGMAKELNFQVLKKFALKKLILYGKNDYL